MDSLKRIFKTIRCYGVGPLLFRLRYEFFLRSGILKKRFPCYQWSDRPLNYWLKETNQFEEADYLQYRKSQTTVSFFFSADDFSGFGFSDKESILQQAEDVLKGHLTYFSKFQKEVSLFPNWHENPFTGQRSNPQKHWLDLRDFNSDQGDIKFIWEASRFAWVFPLIRAYAMTDDEKYPLHFWNWFENWLENNPPNIGVNYKCGQECAIRCMVVILAFYAFMDCEATTPDRLSKMVCMLASHAERIEKNIKYARYQNNNHAISEGTGLFSVGLLFPELKKSSEWMNIGKAVLEESARKQIFKDGAYIQHSMNYHRLALTNYLWILRLSELNQYSFSVSFKEKIRSSFDFLYQMQDSVSGRIPNYGTNDGALVLRLDSCDYLDYRSILGGLYFFFEKKRLYPSGSWDELLQWFFSANSIRQSIRRRSYVSSQYKMGGYYTLRQKDSWAMVRCHTYETRPGHADMLHVDLWYKGKNILCDSGTYCYHTSEPWQSYFSSTHAHNCPVVDEQNQMTRGTRFMWYDWIRSKATMFKSVEDGRFQIFQGQHYGYHRLGDDIIHRRTVIVCDYMCWIVIDDILGKRKHAIKIPWHFTNEVAVNCHDYSRIKIVSGEDSLCLSLVSEKEGGDYRFYNGNDSIPAGWQSNYYGEKKASPVFLLEGQWQLPIRFVTTLGLSTSKDTFRKEENRICWTTDWGTMYELKLNGIESSNSQVVNEVRVGNNRVEV